MHNRDFPNSGFWRSWKTIQPRLRCPSDDLAYRDVLAHCGLAQIPHQWVREENLYLLHGYMLCMDDGGVKGIMIDSADGSGRQDFQVHNVPGAEAEEAAGILDDKGVGQGASVRQGASEVRQCAFKEELGRASGLEAELQSVCGTKDLQEFGV